MTEPLPLAEQLSSPHFGEQSSVEFGVEQRLDTFEEIVRLETLYYALRYIQSQYALPNLTPKQRALAPIMNPMHGVDQISNQFAPKLLDAYLRKDPKEAHKAFRTIEPHTMDQQMATLVNDGQFYNIHKGLRAHLDESNDEIKANVVSRLDPDPKVGQIAFNDRYQFDGNERRSIAEMLKSGVVLVVEPEHHIDVTDALEKSGSGTLPIIEILKNKRIVSINDLGESKISLAVHDAMDHIWLFNLMHQKGLHEKYFDFLESIGNPSFTDIYKREGEIIASIGFGVRCVVTQEHGFVPLYDAQHIRDIFEDYFDRGVLTERHLDAYRILRNIQPHSREWHSLGFTYSNNVVELDEQRRKHGKIKVRDPKTHKVTGEFSEIDPDYLSLFVELHHELMLSKNKTRNNLFMFHILLEEYLQGVATGKIPPEKPFNVRVQNLDDYDYGSTSIPTDRIRWMFRNYGFTATKDALI